jgi:hypothetical protein
MYLRHCTLQKASIIKSYSAVSNRLVLVQTMTQTSSASLLIWDVDRPHLQHLFILSTSQVDLAITLDLHVLENYQGIDGIYISCK